MSEIDYQQLIDDALKDERPHMNKDYETGLSRKDRYILNLIHSKYIENLEKELQEKKT